MAFNYNKYIGDFYRIAEKYDMPSKHVVANVDHHVMLILNYR